MFLSIRIKIIKIIMTMKKIKSSKIKRIIMIIKMALYTSMRIEHVS